MPKWLTLQPEPLIENPNQTAFLDAKKRRFCRACKTEFQCPPNFDCPTCSSKGIRLFDRLTIIAGRRWGKSRIGSIAGAEEATIPNTIGWACAPSNPKLHRYVIPAFQQLIPSDWVESWSSEFLDLRLRNGSLIHFQTLEDPDQGRGQGLDWLWIDEVCELTKSHWEVISPSLADKQGVAFFTTSPRSFDWVYDELFSKAEEGIPGYWGLHTQTKDNPKFKTKEGIEYLLREKETLSELMYRQEYEADFVTFTGSIYGETLKEHHFLRTDARVKEFIDEWPMLDASRQVLVGVDTGADHPFGAVKLVSTEKGLVAVGEYLERNKSFVEHANAMKRLAGSASTKWAINKNEKQPMIELAQHGIMCMPAQNDQVAGIERVKSWLHANQLFIVENNCPRTVKQMKAYRWAENISPKDGSARKEKVHKKEDELPDCIRYALMTWPLLPKHVEVATGRDLSKLPDDMRHAIERVRRIDAPPEKELEPKDMGDFWL